MSYKYTSGATILSGALIVQGSIESANPGDQSQLIQVDGTTVIDKDQKVIASSVTSSGAGGFQSIDIHGGVASWANNGNITAAAVQGTNISGSGVGAFQTLAINGNHAAIDANGAATVRELTASAGIKAVTVSGSGQGSFENISIGGGTSTINNAGAIVGASVSASAAGGFQTLAINGNRAAIDANGAANFREITCSAGILAVSVSGSGTGAFQALEIHGGVGGIDNAGVFTGTGLTLGSAAIVEAELEMIDGITAGTALASKAVVLGAQKDITGINAITASAFRGDGSGLTGVTAGTTVSNLTHNVVLSTGYNYMTGTTNVTCTMPSGSNTDVVHIKAGNLASGHKVTIQTASAQQIDNSNGPITLESPYAAVSMFYVAGTINAWFIV
tara:strand:+ start:15576 stop:16742 length:1167 start_codon:yes stop_codon:yes gene_type:complete